MYKRFEDQILASDKRSSYTIYINFFLIHVDFSGNYLYSKFKFNFYKRNQQSFFHSFFNVHAYILRERKKNNNKERKNIFSCIIFFSFHFNFHYLFCACIALHWHCVTTKQTRVNVNCSESKTGWSRYTLIICNACVQENWTDKNGHTSSTMIFLYIQQQPVASYTVNVHTRSQSKNQLIDNNICSAERNIGSNSMTIASGSILKCWW